MRPALLLAIALVSTALVPAPVAAETTSRLRIGMEVAAIDALKAKGATPDLAMFWLGSWNGDDPSGASDGYLAKAKANDVTPVIQWFYWGDSISPDCVQYGCDGKSRAEWTTAGRHIADSIREKMGGSETLVVIEPEFNKGGIESWDTFDGLWVEHAKVFHDVPGVKVVLSFGNWGRDKWGNFDRAIAEADMLGFQTMRGSTKTTLSTYQSTADSIATAASEIKTKWGKPSLLTDLALSSYPEPDYLAHQKDTLAKVLARADDYAALGLTGIVYRSFKDSPGMSLENHFGEAERHWGLAWSDGTVKPAFAVWKDYARSQPVATEPAPEPTPEPTPEPAPSAAPFAATFTPKAGNEWWVETKVTANEALKGVTVSVDGGTPKALALKSWGTWAVSTSAPEGSKVVFTATSSDGDKATSAAYRWPDASAYTEPAPAPAPAPFAWKKEAESAATKSTGGKTTDGAASGGAAWNLWANGYVQDGLKAPVSDTYRIAVKVKGTSLGGVQAAFDLVVDGKVVGSWSATSGYKEFAKTVTLGAGSHGVKVVFKNDAKSATEDRNLVVDVLTVAQQ